MIRLSNNGNKDPLKKFQNFAFNIKRIKLYSP